jgi:hypothetical protein
LPEEAGAGAAKLGVPGLCDYNLQARPATIRTPFFTKLRSQNQRESVKGWLAMKRLRSASPLPVDEGAGKGEVCGGGSVVAGGWVSRAALGVAKAYCRAPNWA